MLKRSSLVVFLKMFRACDLSLFAASCAQGREDDEMPYSTPNSEWEVFDTFEPGEEIEIDVVIVYYHWVRNPSVFWVSYAFNVSVLT